MPRTRPRLQRRPFYEWKPVQSQQGSLKSAGDKKVEVIKVQTTADRETHVIKTSDSKAPIAESGTVSVK